MDRRGEFISAFAIGTIMIVIFLAVMYDFTQGASGVLREDDESISMSNDSETPFAKSWDLVTSTVDVMCTNTTPLVENTDFFFNVTSSKVWYNSTNICGNESTNQTWVVDYDYYSDLYLGDRGKSGLSRTIMSYVAVIIALLIVALAFGYTRG